MSALAWVLVTRRADGTVVGGSVRLWLDKQQAEANLAFVRARAGQGWMRPGETVELREVT